MSVLIYYVTSAFFRCNRSNFIFVIIPSVSISGIAHIVKILEKITK